MFNTFYKLLPFYNIKFFGTDSFEEFELCKYFPESFFRYMESICKIRKKFLARCRKSCTSDTEKELCFILIIYSFPLKIENTGIYFRSWDEVIFCDKTYFLNSFTSKFESERKIGIIISFFLTNLVAYFFLHKNHHFLWLIFQFMKESKKDGGSYVIRNIGNN